MSKVKKSLDQEYEEIIKQAQKQPGMAELMKVYGEYDEYLIKSQAYLGLRRTAKYFSNTSSSS